MFNLGSAAIMRGLRLRSGAIRRFKFRGASTMEDRRESLERINLGIVHVYFTHNFVLLALCAHFNNRNHNEHASAHKELR